MRAWWLPLLLLTVSPALADEPVETSEDWYAFSRKFTDRLREEFRDEDALDELTVCGKMRPTQWESWSEAALVALQAGTRPPEQLIPGSVFHGFAEYATLEAIRRGGAGDPRLAYVIGRLRFADALAYDAVEALPLWTVARSMFEEAIAGGFEPDTVRQWRFRAVLNQTNGLLAQGDARQVTENLSALLETESNALGVTRQDVLFAMLNLAEGHRQIDERAKSMEILERAKIHSPSDCRPYVKIGRLHLDEGRPEEALAAYRLAYDRAIESAADPTLFHEIRIRMVESMFDCAEVHDGEAEQILEHYVHVMRDHPARLAIGLYWQARYAARRGDLDVAARHLRRACRLRPDDLMPLVELSGVLHRLGEQKELEEVKAKIEQLRLAQDKGDTMDGK